MSVTPEQLASAETMPLDELRALAIKEAEEATAVEPKTAPARDDKGRFTNAEELDNSGEPQDEEEVATGPTLYRKEIDNGNGVIEVFEADSLEELVDKIAEGKRNASIKIRELSQKVKVEDTRTQQQKDDEAYVVVQRLQKDPKAVVTDLVKEAIAEQQAATQRSQDAQNKFVSTHPDFIANPKNGNEMMLEVQRLGYTEFTVEGLEKAYQSLKQRGILELKAEEADGEAEVETTDTERIAQPKVEATQQPSRRKGSTISTRNRPSATNANVQPTEDEAYAMPMEKLREIANKQLLQRNSTD